LAAFAIRAPGSLYEDHMPESAASKTAVVLIGFQNDYFDASGILAAALEDRAWCDQMLSNTLDLLKTLHDEPVLMISTPIVFTPDYSELVEPTGILKTIKDTGAFKGGCSGAETIPELRSLGDRIVEVPGKRGLNAFSNTDLDDLLREHGVERVALAGVVTSICIDSTGRAAHERGYQVSVLSDCTAGRTAFEQEFYCEKVFPIYAEVLDRGRFVHDVLETE